MQSPYFMTKHRARAPAPGGRRSGGGRPCAVWFVSVQDHRCLREGLHDRRAAVLEAIALAGFEHHVLAAVLLGDPHGPFARAHGAACAVAELERLAASEMHCASAEFD